MPRTKKTPKKKIGKFLKYPLKKMKKPFMYPVYGFFLLILVLVSMFPDKVGEFIWIYYWGPLVADARGGFVGSIKEGYNPISTLTYAILLSISIYLIHRLFRKRRMLIDSGFVVSLVPIMVLGGVARVLEDASVFITPGSYILISPLIYMWLGTIALFFVLYSDFLERRERYEAMVLCAIPYPLILRILWFLMPFSSINEDALWFISVMALFSAFHIFFVRRKEYERNSSIFLYSMYFLVLMSYYLVLTVAREGIPHPYEVPIIFAISLAGTTVFFLASRLTSAPLSELFGNRINMLLIFSHMFDATATWRGVSFYSYGEKHVLPSFLMGVPYGPLLFIVVKVLFAILFIYLLDVVYKKDMGDDARNLIKLAIIVLGLAPGIRDAVRISLGV